MYPTIHNFKGDDLKTQGYGALSDCISCEVTEELNGGFTLELRHPLNGAHSEYLTVGNIIMARPSHNQTLQPFRINQVKKSFANSIMVYANHISYDLSGYAIREPATYTSLSALLSALNSMSWGSVANYHQFTFATDMTSSDDFTMAGIQSVRSWMGGQEGSIIDTYGGEWIYDNFQCFLTSRRGQDTGIRISYGKNLAEYTKEQENTLYSHACAFWKKSNDLAYGNFVSTGIDCAFRVAYIDASNAFQSKPTTAQLDAYATNEITGLTSNKQTITVTPAQIGNDVIGLGDSVLICYEKVFETRVIKTVWDVLAGNYKTLELGAKKADIADIIKSLTNDKGSSAIKSVTVSGTPNSYGCLNTNLPKDCIVICADTPTDNYDDSSMITPFVAGGVWWIRATKWQDGWSAVTTATSVVVYYI